MSVYQPYRCSSACHHLGESSRLPYRWDLNPYRGCEHQCRYCFALYSHRYLETAACNTHDTRYFHHIWVKENLPEQLERQLRSPSWRGEVINLGGVTDCYQPAERHFRLMPAILRLLIKYRNPCSLSTKSDLILRDLDLIQELAQTTSVTVAVTVTCLEEELQQKLEPGAVSPSRRLNLLRELKRTGAGTSFHLMPILPHLTDSPQQLEELHRQARDCGVDYLIADPLNLRGETRQVFFAFLRREFPQLYPVYLHLYRDGRLDLQYCASLRPVLQGLLSKYRLSANCRARGAGPEESRRCTQLSLFD